jgi:hypothetical protein
MIASPDGCWTRAVSVSRAPNVSWRALLQPELGREVWATALVVSLARVRLTLEAVHAEDHVDAVVHGGVAVIRLGCAPRANDLAEAVAACNQFARNIGAGERVVFGRLASTLRSARAFQDRILAPSVGLSKTMIPRPAIASAALVRNWVEYCLCARVHAIAVTRFEMADKTLHEAMALWLMTAPASPPYLILDYEVNGKTLLVTNAPQPGGSL